MAAIIKAFEGRGLLVQTDTGELSAPEANSEAFAELRLLGRNHPPTARTPLPDAGGVTNTGQCGCQTRGSLETDCRLLAQRLTLLYTSTSEHSEISTFSALIAHLIDADLISEDQSGSSAFRSKAHHATGTRRTGTRSRGKPSGAWQAPDFLNSNL